MAKTAKLTLQKICAFVFTNLQIDQMESDEICTLSGIVW